MEPYKVLLYICIISTIVSIKRNSCKELSWALFLISSIYAIALVSLRDKSIGTDTFEYWWFFCGDQYGYSGYDIEKIDVGYRFFQKIVRLFTSNANVFIFLLGFLSLGPICFVINRVSQWKNYSVFLLISLGTTTICYILFFSMLRQCLAFGLLTIILYLYSEGILKRNYKLFLLLLCAILLHKTVLFCVPLFFLDLILFKKKWLYVSLSCSFILGLSMQSYAPTMRLISMSLFDGKYNYYANVLEDNFYQIGVTLPLNIICFLIIFLGKERFLQEFYTRVFLVGVVVNNLLCMAGNSDRLTMYFIIYGCIVIPNFLETLNSRKFVKYGIMLLTVLYYSHKFLKVFENASENTMIALVPYKSFL